MQNDSCRENIIHNLFHAWNKVPWDQNGALYDAEFVDYLLLPVEKKSSENAINRVKTDYNHLLQ